MCLNSTTKQKREKSWDWKEEIRDLMEFEWEAVDGVSATFTKQLNADDVIKLVEKLLKQREEELERKHKEEMRKAIDEERKKVANISKKIYQGAIREAIDEALWEGMRLFIPIVANKKNTKIINKKYKITRKELYKKFSLKDK